MNIEMKKQILPYQRWFGSFARSYLKEAALEEKQAMGLKLLHSQKVRHLSKTLAEKIGLEQRGRFLAELCGLFHDIGRLPQFKRYKTFLDAKSEDHARLSVETLKKEKVLAGLSGKEKDMVLDAVLVHNKFSIPDDFHGLKLILSKVLRDADKIDIWRVFDEFYKKGIGSQEINLGLPPGRSVSDAVIEDFASGQMVRLENVKNQLDFMVMRLGWLYDINFKQSLKIIAKRGYIDTIFDRLPDSGKKEIIKEKTAKLLQERLGR